MTHPGLRFAPACLAFAAVLHAAPDLQSAIKKQVLEKYDAAPLNFVENRGQAANDVDFVSSGFGQRITTRRTGFDIYTANRQKKQTQKVSVSFDMPGTSGQQGRLLEPTDDRSAFMIGGRKASGLVNYHKAQYDNVWPGASVVYYGTGKALEYDVVLSPGADVNQVGFRFSGVKSAEVNVAGDLVLETAGRPVVQRKPVVYQNINGHRVDVKGSYRLAADGRLGFTIGAYDHQAQLVIDPLLTFTETVSSLDPSTIAAFGAALDTSGHAYIVGETVAVNHGFSDAFVLELNASGGRIGSQAFEFGGNGVGSTIATAVTVDTLGNVYVVGLTADTGLTCSTCGFQGTHAAGSNNDAFLVSLAPSFATTPGGAVNYVTYIGGTGDDAATSVAVLGPTVVYVAGNTTSTDFPISIGNGLAGAQNAFLVKVDTTKVTGPTSKLFARYIGGNGTDTGLGVAVDPSADAYVTGTTTSSAASFVPNANNGFLTSRVSSTDGYLDKIDPTGASSLYFTFFGNGQASAVAVLNSVAYVGGRTPGALSNVTANAYQTVYGGGLFDAFIASIDTSKTGSTSLLYNSYLGGPGDDEGSGIAVDNTGRASLVGFAAAGFPVYNAIQPIYGGGTSDAFFAQINPTLSGTASLISSTYLGTSANEQATAIGLNGNSAVMPAILLSNSNVSGSVVYGINGLEALQLITVAPCRIFDTRVGTGTFGGPFIAGGTTRTIPVQSSACNIPSTAIAYSLNATVQPRNGILSFLTLFPTGQLLPSVSTLNSVDGSTIANAAIVPAGTNGSINAYATDNTELILDINGYFVLPNASSQQFYPVTPCRVKDTRFSAPVAGGSTLTVPVTTSSCGIPAGASAFAFNVTVVPRGYLGFLTAYPTGQSQPVVSTLNSFDGTTLANAAIVPAGTGGSVNFYASNTTDLIVDINGYFAPPSGTGLNFFPAPPCRIADTRLSGGPLANLETRTFSLSSGPCGIPSAAQATSLNITVVPPTRLDYLTAYPTGASQPVVSTLNDPKGLPLANAAIVPDTNGSINVFVSNSTNVIIDTNGYFGQ